MFKTTVEQREKLKHIAEQMLKSNVPAKFVQENVKIAEDCQGHFDMMDAWLDAADDAEKDDVLYALAEEVDEEAESREHREPIPSMDLEDIEEWAKATIARKQLIKAEILQKFDSLEQASVAADYPASFLGKFLDSPVPPRQTTLYRLANRLGLPLKAVA